uniref:Uncharacterized protein n=1 Tax=Arundo donax TaxID=35708 RepID=A0A0A9HP41_ARUDO
MNRSSVSRSFSSMRLTSGKSEERATLTSLHQA